MYSDTNNNWGKLTKNDNAICQPVFNSVSEYTDNGNLHGLVYIGDRKRHWIERFFKSEDLVFEMI